MKCDKCANYLSGLDTCKFCSFEEDKSADHRLDAFRHLYESVMHQKLFGKGFKPYVTLAGNPYELYEYKKGDNMIEDVKIKYDNVTVNGVKAKSFSLNAKDNEVIVEWEEEDFDLEETIELLGINNGVNPRLDKFGVDYVDCFYDSAIQMLYVRTNTISSANKFNIIDCLNIDVMNVTTLFDKKHNACGVGSNKGWFAIRVD